MKPLRKTLGFVIMKRKIYDKLLQWKREKNGATALMIEGARRVGKSYIAREFARNEYDSLSSSISARPHSESEAGSMSIWKISIRSSRTSSSTIRKSLQLENPSLSLMKSRNALKPARPSKRWWKTVASTIWRQAHSYLSRKTLRTLSFHPRRTV